MSFNLCALCGLHEGASINKTTKDPWCDPCLLEYARFYFERIDHIQSEFLISKVIGFKGDRIKAALKKAKDSGTRLGRPEKTPKTMIKQILECRTSGDSYRTIKKKFPISNGTLTRVLRTHGMIGTRLRD